MSQAREKVITVRFPNTCRRCGEAVAVGSRGLWTPGKGISHYSCPNPTPVEIKTPRQTEALTRIFDYADIRKAFGDFMQDRYSIYKRSHHAADMIDKTWRNDPSWVGISVAEMEDFISHGYRVAGLDQVAGLIPVKPRRKLNYAEEGDELMLDLALAGEDNPFQTWEKRNRKPGLTVEIHMVFNSSADTRRVNAYQRWIARALQTLDENGVDMDVQIVIRTERAADDYGVIRDTKIRVRKSGEAADFSNWSAMFSPGGFRMLGILAIAMNVESEGKTVATGHGRPMPYGSFTVDYDAERNVMVIGNEDNVDFPENEMTEKLTAILSKLSG